MEHNFLGTIGEITLKPFEKWSRDINSREGLEIAVRDLIECLGHVKEQRS